jgi:tetratricopeptide (TPR) repeat protein
MDYRKHLSGRYCARQRFCIKGHTVVLSAYTNHVDAWCNKGGALVDKLSQTQEGLQCFDQVIAIDPNQVNAWYNKGVTLDKLGKIQEALQSFDRAIAIDPNYASAWLGKGALFDISGRTQEADECKRRVKSLDPKL